MTEPSRPFDRLDYTYKLLVVIALLITVLILARDIVIPVVFAGLIAVVMLPLVKKLEDRRVPSAIAITLVLLLTIVVFGLLIWLVVNQVVNLVNDLPDLEVRFDNYVDQLKRMARNDLGITKADQNKYINDSMKSVSAYLGDLIITTSNTLSILVQIPIYVFLFLIYRDKFRNFFLELLGTSEMLWKQEIERVIKGYVSGLMLVTLIIAALNSIGLLIVGIDHAIFFGILSGMLTIIPYVGIIIGAAFPVILALITKDSWWYAIGVIIVFSIVQFLEGNFITPKITGSKVSINAFAAIIALLIGGKILGIAGMILAVPAIGIMRVLLSQSPHLRPFVILLEDKNGAQVSTEEPVEMVIKPPAADDDQQA
jgi:predicted PurR-regulated permease PerM